MNDALNKLIDESKLKISPKLIPQLIFVCTAIGWILTKKVEISVKSFYILYDDNDIEDTWIELIEKYLIILFSVKQYQTVGKIFQDYPELKDRLKPIYYLTMEYLKDEYPNEYLKAGEEMRETIEELKERVKWFEENLG